MTDLVLSIPVDETVPEPEDVMRAQGVPHGVIPGERTRALLAEALASYRATAEPQGVLTEIHPDDFQQLFRDCLHNDPEAPVGPISRFSEGCALFAVTVGEHVCREISGQFRANDFASGAMLDAVASEAAELAADAAEDAYRGLLRSAGRLRRGQALLRFSPGYCGWDLASQHDLFLRLRPERIGVSLNARFLMSPLKSVSGVICAGRKEIFMFDDTFSFCRDCATHECRQRIESLLGE